jgi:hypothetical protein
MTTIFMKTTLFSFTSQLILPNAYMHISGQWSSTLSPTFVSPMSQSAKITQCTQILWITQLAVTLVHSLIAPGKSFSLRQQAAPFNQHEILNDLASFCSSSPKDPSSLTKSAAWENIRYHGFGPKSRTKKIWNLKNQSHCK